MGTDGLIPDLPVCASDMIDHQSRVYSREVARGIPKDIYRSLTHISLFCFEDGTYGRGLIASKMRRTRHASMITPISTGKTREIRYVKHSVIPDFVHHLSGDGLRSSSSKYSALIAALERSEGNAFVFVEEVRGSGLLLLACVLERHGYELYVGEDPSKLVPKKRYTLCVGSADISPNNTERLDGFNSELNKHGDYVRVLLGSKVIGESITLLNVRQFHCITPHWNDSPINQAVGRVVRNGSHTALLPEERRVDIYIHASVLQERPESSIDIIKLQICQKKQADIQRVEKAMIDHAVDRYCLINKSAVATTDFRTFSAAYIQHHISDIIKRLALTSKPLGDIDILSDNANIHPIVCNEAICRIITSNTQVADGLYLRAYGNTVFTVKDPSLPYVTLPPLGAAEPGAEREVDNFPEGFLVGSTRCEVVSMFRFMPVKKKIELLEHCITNGLSYILQHISTVYARIGDVVYHLLWYLHTQALSLYLGDPVERQRGFCDGVWRTLKVHEEQEVLDSYRDLVSNLMDHVDECPVYGVISVIDGDMRLRLRNIEDFNMSVKDRRYVRRGKNIKSIKKVDLAHIRAFVDNIAGKPESNSCGPISSIIKHIDSVVVGMEIRRHINSGEGQAQRSGYQGTILQETSGNIIIIRSHSDDIIGKIIDEIEPEDSANVFLQSELDVDPVNNSMIGWLIGKEIPWHKLPVIKMKDPIRRWHNFPHNSVVAIERDDGTYFRRVCP
eukprot:SM000112S24010  [mRNA]  locus=s112:451574:454129:- [translate_table: standard]